MFKFRTSVFIAYELINSNWLFFFFVHTEMISGYRFRLFRGLWDGFIIILLLILFHNVPNKTIWKCLKIGENRWFMDEEKLSKLKSLMKVHRYGVYENAYRWRRLEKLFKILRKVDDKMFRKSWFTLKHTFKHSRVYSSFAKTLNIIVI